MKKRWFVVDVSDMSLMVSPIVVETFPTLL